MKHCNNSRCPKHPSASSIFRVTSHGFFSLPTWTSSDFFRVKTWRHCNAKRATLQLLGFQAQNEQMFVGVIPIIQSFNHPIIQSSNLFFGYTGYGPGRLTCFPYKSPMKRKENDLNQTSMILFHVKPIFIIQSFNHPIIQSCNHPIFGGGILPQSSQSSSAQLTDLSRLPHLGLIGQGHGYNSAQPDPETGQVGLNRRLPRDACALPSRNMICWCV